MPTLDDKITNELKAIDYGIKATPVYYLGIDVTIAPLNQLIVTMVYLGAQSLYKNCNRLFVSNSRLQLEEFFYLSQVFLDSLTRIIPKHKLHFREYFMC
mgnify:CR=1 FL=1